VCRSVLEEIILSSVGWMGRQICKYLVEGVAMEEGWEFMERRSLIAEIGDGGIERKRAIEHSLRDERETEEAARMILREEEEITRRMEKARKLEEGWRKRLEEKRVEKMTEKLEGLSLIDWSLEVDE
jgi:hypothetical protein